MTGTVGATGLPATDGSSPEQPVAPAGPEPAELSGPPEPSRPSESSRPADASRLPDAPGSSDEPRRRGHLLYLADASELLAASLDVDLTLALVAQLCVPRLGRWCVIHAVDDPECPELVVAVHADERVVPLLEQAFLGENAAPLLDRVRQAALASTAVPLSGPVPGVVFPLAARRQVVATMTVGEPAGRRHTVEEITIAADLARRAALAVDNARLYSERDAVAQALQGALLPPRLPQAVGVEFGAEYAPAGQTNDVGGDFYDVLPLGPDRWMLAVGDVCGKGPEAASITGLARDVLRILTREGRDLPYALSALNSELAELGERARFCTVAAAMVERDGTRLRVRLCVAGHPLPVLVSGGGSSFVGTSGVAVGLTDTIELPESELVLGQGDALVFYTDGITERRDGSQQFGEENVLRTLGGCGHLGASRIAERLRSTVTGFGTEPLRDDLAILVVRNGSPERAEQTRTS